MVRIRTRSSFVRDAKGYVRIAIQLARLSGFSPIITMSSLRHEEFLKSIGTTHVIDHTLALSAVQSEVLKLVGGKPIEFAFNSISAADTQTLAYDLLAPGGDLLLVNPEAITAEKKKDGNNKTVMSMFADVHTPATRDVLVALYSRLTEWLETGTIVVRALMGYYYSAEKPGLMCRT